MIRILLLVALLATGCATTHDDGASKDYLIIRQMHQ